MSERRCKDFIESYMWYTAPLEPPDNYHKWSALSALAAVVRRKAWIDMGYFRIYPNLFIILVGPAGARKGTAINAAYDLVDDVAVDDPSILKSADSITREALIRAMERSTRSTEIDGYKYTHASYTLVSRELGVMLKQQSHDFIMLLTDLFDSSKMWKYETISRQEERLQNVWLNFIGATTPKWLYSEMPEDAIGSGFTSRVLFIVERGPRQKTALPVITPVLSALREDLVHDLNIYKDLAGPMVFSKDALELYTSWYESSEDSIHAPHFAGYNSRKHVHMFKIAMLLAISKGSFKIIEAEHVAEALAYLKEMEPKMVSAFDAVGRSSAAEDIAQIQDLFEEHGRLSKAYLRTVTFRDVDLDNFDKILQALVDTKFVKIEIDTATGEVYYIHIPRGG